MNSFYIKPKKINNKVTYRVFKRLPTLPVTNVLITEFTDYKAALKYTRELIDLQRVA
jgi:hypothetical protein